MYRETSKDGGYGAAKTQLEQPGGGSEATASDVTLEVGPATAPR